MGGILACYGVRAGTKRKEFVRAARLLRHRGPDWSGLYSCTKAVLAHELLSVDGFRDHAQPLFSEDNDVVVVANAEIYNRESLCELLALDPEMDASDCHILIALYQRYGTEMVEYLDGVFSFAIYDQKKDFFLVARDAIGITSLYQGWDPFTTDAVYFASEAKALKPFCHDIMAVPPGSMFCSKGSPFRKFYRPTWWKPGSFVPHAPVLETIRSTLTQSVVKRLNKETSWGVLLSGGLDCSIIASIAVGEQRRLCPETKVRTFAIGLEGDPHLDSAQQTAEFLGTSHQGFVITAKEGLDAVMDAIYHLETFDPTTVRAGIMMYLLARKVKSLGIKVVLNGDGSDAIFAGHDHFRNTPNAEALQEEIVKSVREIHWFDCLRAHKSSMAWGLQCRMPFLDPEMLDLVCSMSPSEKLITEDRVEKHVLRQAFDVYNKEYERQYLPHDVLWQHAERCMNDVDERWVDVLTLQADRTVPRKVYDNRAALWPHLTPKTKEGCWYRLIFEHFYGEEYAETVRMWTPTCFEQLDSSTDDESISSVSTEVNLARLGTGAWM